MDLHIGMADGVQRGFCGLVAQVPDVDVHHGELRVYELGEGVIKSIFPSRESATMRLKPSRLRMDSPEIPSVDAGKQISHFGNIQIP